MTGIAFLVLFLVTVGGALGFLIWFGDMREGTDEGAGLPTEVGAWHADTTSPAALAAAAEGLEREERLFHDRRSGFGPGRLVRQVRYRARETGQVLRVDPDVVVTHHRVRPGRAATPRVPPRD
ncbi:MAG: hypothetical protein JW751_03625 [Polyangiaceae bacterium]|nr:hypothetical protein [Polyangiaceae bacterium]